MLKQKTSFKAIAVAGAIDMQGRVVGLVSEDESIKYNSLIELLN